MSNPLKVCIIGPSADSSYLGGVATHIRNLKSLSCFTDAVVIDLGSVHSNVRVGIFKIAKSIAGLRKKILAGAFSHVLVNASIYPTSLLKLLGILASLPHREEIEIHVFFHGGRFTYLNPKIASVLNRVLRPLLMKAKKFHFLSRVQMDGFRKLFDGYENWLFANYSPADEICENSRALTDDGLKLLFVGRVVKEKGVFELVSAIEEISKDEPSIKLTVVGDGPALADLAKRSETLPAGLFHFMGHLSGPELEGVYRNADALMLPSYYHEGFPYTVIEAMHAGLPIISTNEGALETLVRDGVTGLKVQPQDVDSIVTAIKKVLHNKSLLEEMSKNCYRYFQENLSRSAAEKFYSQLLGSQSDVNGKQ